MEEEVKKLIEENLKLTREVHAMVVKVRRYMMWQRFVSFIYLILVVGPLILAIIYLPPIIKPILQQYQSIWQSFSDGSGSNRSPSTTTNGDVSNNKTIDFDQLLKAAEPYLKTAPK